MSNNPSYRASSKLIHWSMALLIISMLCLGLSMVKSLAVWQIVAVRLHQSFGIIVLILVVVRLFNTLIYKHPQAKSDLPWWQSLVASATHFGLYVAMILMPVSGYLMQNAGGERVAFFGLVSLPAIVPQNIELYALFRETHGLVAYAFIALLCMHIGAALFHGFVKQDNILRAMWFKR